MKGCYRFEEEAVMDIYSEYQLSASDQREHSRVSIGHT